VSGYVVYGTVLAVIPGGSTDADALSLFARRLCGSLGLVIGTSSGKHRAKQ